MEATPNEDVATRGDTGVLTPASGQSLSVRSSDLESQITKFFHDLFDSVTHTGPLYLNIARKGDWKGAFFLWPEQAEAAAMRSLAWDREGFDVFLCAALMTEKDRKKEFAARIGTLWLDGDDGADLKRGPEPSIIVKSSHDHVHAYYRLNSAVDPAKAEELNRRLAAITGADKSGFDLAQLLRVPCTHNYKPQRLKDGKAPEVVIVKELCTPHNLEKLEKLLPLVSKQEAAKVELDPNEPPMRLSRKAQELWFGSNSIKKSDGKTTDRSETLWAIAMELAKMGLTVPWIAKALQERDMSLSFNKFVDRPAQYKEIAVKVIAELSKPENSVALFRSSKEINENPSPDPEWLVDNLFLVGQIGLIGGPTYAGKSLFAMDVAVSLATGTNVVGHPDLAIPRKIGVLYVYAEQGEGQWEQRMFAIERHRRVQPDGDIPLYLKSGYELNLTDVTKRADFIASLKQLNIEVVIFDPLAVLFRSEDENDVTKVIAAVRDPLQEFVKAGIMPIAVHHSTKRALDHQPYDALELVRGSSDISAMTGSIIGVWDGKKAGTKIITRVRGESVRPFRLKKKDEKGLPLKYSAKSVEYMASDSVRILTYDGPWEKPEGSTEDEILEYLRQHKTATARQIADAYGLGTRTTQDYLKKLRESQRVRSEKKGKEWLYSVVEQTDKAA